MVGDITTLTENGTQQSGPLLPLLSNVLRDLLDKELERRGLAFVRYADDGNIYVKSQRAGERVMASITEFIEKKLKLKVNCSKSAVDKLSKRKFLGFTVGSRVKKVLNCWGHRRDLLMKFVGRVMPFNATFQSLRL
jgi:hypothetical protein